MQLGYWRTDGRGLHIKRFCVIGNAWNSFLRLQHATRTEQSIVPIPLYRNGLGVRTNLCGYHVCSLWYDFRAVSIIVHHCELSVTVFCGLLSFIVNYCQLLSLLIIYLSVIPVLFTRYSTAPCSIESWYFWIPSICLICRGAVIFYLCCVQLFLRPQPIPHREYGLAYQPQRLLTSWLAWKPVYYLINNTSLLYKVMSYKEIFNVVYSYLCRCIYLLCVCV